MRSTDPSARSGNAIRASECRIVFRGAGTLGVCVSCGLDFGTRGVVGICEVVCAGVSRSLTSIEVVRCGTERRGRDCRRRGCQPRYHASRSTSTHRPSLAVAPIGRLAARAGKARQRSMRPTRCTPEADHDTAPSAVPRRAGARESRRGPTASPLDVHDGHQRPSLSTPPQRPRSP